MRRRLSVAWIAALLIFGAARARAWTEGENFAPPFEPPAAEWELVPDPKRPESRIWKSRQNEKEHFRIDVLRGSPDSVAEVRMAMDGPGKASCASFDTTTIREARQNGYPRLLWRTDCVRGDGAKTTLLQLAIRGREAVYLVLKSWPGEVARADVDVWLERFERAFVCDTRSPDQGCPAGLDAGRT